MTWLQPLTLEGKTTTLAPLAMAHHDDLVEATKDGELWNLWYTSVPTAGKVGEEIERRRALQEAGSMLPFTIIERATGQAVGMTTYMNIDAAAKRVEIGSTWYRKRVQRGPMNTECKLLLLQHAFETLAHAEPTRDRTPRSETRRGTAKPSSDGRWINPGHLCLQHHQQ